MKVRLAIATCAVIGWASPTFAQETSIEFTDGPVANSSRVVGMGGAFVGVGEGADGQRTNPAAYTSRYGYSRNDFFDWDFTFYNQRVPGEEGSYDLSGRPGSIEDAGVIGFGLDFKLSIMGAGFHAYSAAYNVRVPDASSLASDGKKAVSINSQLVSLGVAWAIPWMDLQIGIAQLVGSYGIFEESIPVATKEGSGLQVGTLWMPTGERYRMGASWRTEIDAFTDVVLPEQQTRFTRIDGLRIPKQIAVGGSYMFGERPYNPPRNWGSKRHFGPDGPEELPRHYVLVSAELGVTAPVANAVGAESFVAGQTLESGEYWSLTTKMGAEWEFWPNWARVRGGYYWEPSRIAEIEGRHHVTAGFDLKLPLWILDAKLQGVVDLARGYQNVGFGAGLWY